MVIGIDFVTGNVLIMVVTGRIGVVARDVVLRVVTGTVGFVLLVKV